MIIKTITRLTIIIFFMSIINFKNASSNYEKNIFDFIVKSINGKEINLSKYITNTTIFPKIQEVETKYLVNCLYNLYLNKNFRSASEFLVCSHKSQADIREEVFKRIVKPFFIPGLVLVASLIILFNKDYFNYSKIQYTLFITGFFILVISEISARYVTNNLTTILFLVLPIIIFMISGILLHQAFVVFYVKQIFPFL